MVGILLFSGFVFFCLSSKNELVSGKVLGGGRAAVWSLQSLLWGNQEPLSQKTSCTSVLPRGERQLWASLAMCIFSLLFFPAPLPFCCSFKLFLTQSTTSAFVSRVSPSHQGWERGEGAAGGSNASWGGAVAKPGHSNYTSFTCSPIQLPCSALLVILSIQLPCSL